MPTKATNQEGPERLTHCEPDARRRHKCRGPEQRSLMSESPRDCTGEDRERSRSQQCRSAQDAGPKRTQACFEQSCRQENAHVSIGDRARRLGR